MALLHRPLHSCLYFFLTLGLLAASPRDTDGWEDLNRLDPLAAQSIFSAGTDRSSRLGLALTLLSLQPQTDARMAEARTLLQAVQRENPHDDLGIAATYQLARIAQLFAQPANPTAAIAAYRALLREHAGNPIAERAAPKLATLLLYADVPATTWERHVAEINALLPALQSASAQRDTRLVLADALLRLHNDHARALPLLDYCLQNNLIVRPPSIALALLTAAECARVVGHRAEAAAYYRRYMQEFPREPSASEAARRAARLSVEVAP